MSYEEEDEFADIEPLERDPAESAVVPIAYSKEFALTFGRLRRILATGEVPHWSA